MKTLTDIMKNPQIALSRMQDGVIEELLQFGPYLLMHEQFPYQRADFPYSKRPLLRYLLDMAEYVRMESNETATFKEKKEFLLKMMEDSSPSMMYGDVYINGYANWCATRTNQYAESSLHKLRNIQYKDACVESAMTGYCPIVPYGIPMMKLPLKNKKSEDLEEQIDYKLKMRDALEMLLNCSNMAVVSELQNATIRLLIDYAPVILTHTEYTIDIDPAAFPSQENDSSLFKFPLPDWTMRLLSGQEEVSASEFYAMAYYLLAFRYYLGDTKLDCSNLDTLVQKAREIAAGAVPTFESLLEMSDLFSVPEKADDVFTEPIELHKKFEEDQEKDTSITPVDKRNEEEQEKDFNADILLGYIYTHRRFKQDNYTNQAFLAQYDNIKDYSYMQDNIMICTVKDKYLCSPAIDLTGINNYQLVLICLDKDDHVFFVKSPDDLPD